MNAEELKELAATLNGMAEGKEWECWHASLDRFALPVGRDVEYCIENRIPIRLKPWVLPTPPDGMQWHRDDWTEDMLPDGYRPLCLFEQTCISDEFCSDGVWHTYEKDWGKALSWHYPHRTKRPLPQPKPIKVPLGPDDIKAGDEFLVGSDRYGWLSVKEVTVTLGSDGIYLFDELMDRGVKIRSIGETEWRPCHKEVEA